MTNQGLISICNMPANAQFASSNVAISTTIYKCKTIAKSISNLGMNLMAIRADLESWIVSALKYHGGRASVTAISKYVWENYEDQIRKQGNAFYTWQYDLRWVGQKLQKEGKLIKHHSGWELTI